MTACLCIDVGPQINAFDHARKMVVSNASFKANKAVLIPCTNKIEVIDKDGDHSKVNPSAVHVDGKDVLPKGEFNHLDFYLMPPNLKECTCPYFMVRPHDKLEECNMTKSGLIMKNTQPINEGDELRFFVEKHAKADPEALEAIPAAPIKRRRTGKVTEVSG